jgi:hypothetical protein
MHRLELFLLAVAVALPACTPSSPQPGDLDAQVEPPDASVAGPDAGSLPDAGSGVPDAGSKAAQCASQFGSELTAAFGRLDGTLLAVVGPTDSQCTYPNGDHLVVQVLMHGAAYRIVVNVLSDGRNGTDTRIRYAEVPHALVGEPFAEGWHPGAALDYPGTLGAHDADFAFYDMAAVVQKASDRLSIGAKVSAYATSSGGATAASAHLVHRNPSYPNTDGALVIGPDTASPLFLLFNFDGQTF